MRATCDTACNMGYIHLMSPNNNIDHFAVNSIENYVDKSKMKIPQLNGLGILDKLNSLKIADKTYRQALADGEFEEEYYNDWEEDGYMSGIELKLNKHTLLAYIKRQVFRVYNLVWQSKDYLVVTLNYHGEVFNPDNIIFPLNANKDVWVIMKIIEGSKTGLVTALISSRKDLYPIGYLTKPLFYLWE